MAALTRVVALALSLSAWPAHAQMTTGSISGRITDAQGAAVPGVTIEARNADTGLVRVAVSNDAGTYRLSALPVGTYAVTAQLSGFRRFVTASACLLPASRVRWASRLQARVWKKSTGSPRKSKRP